MGRFNSKFISENKVDGNLPKDNEYVVEEHATDSQQIKDHSREDILVSSVHELIESIENEESKSFVPESELTLPRDKQEDEENLVVTDSESDEENKVDSQTPQFSASKSQKNELDSDMNEKKETVPTQTDLREYSLINVNDIQFSKYNSFNKNDSTEAGKELFQRLVNSIAVFGLENPLLVNQKGDSYILISGERRLRAVKSLGWETVPCIVAHIEDTVTEKGMLISANIETRSLSSFEMFRCIDELQDIYAELSNQGKVSGGKYKYISNYLSISKRQLVKYTSIMNNFDLLTELEKEMLEKGELSINEASKRVTERKAAQSYSDNTEYPLQENHNMDKIAEDDTSEETTSETEHIDESQEKPSTYTEENEQEPIDNSDLTDDSNTNKTEEQSKDNVTSAEEKSAQNPKHDIDGESLKDNTSQTSHQDAAILLSCNDFIDILFNPALSKNAQMYQGISKSTNKRIFGLPLQTNEKTYLVFPSTIQAVTPQEKAKKISFTCYEVFEDTLTARERNQK